MSALLLCVMMATADDAAAAKALETFEATWKKDKSSDGKTAAVNELAKTLHEKVCAKLSSLLTNDDKQVKAAAATGLGTFKDPAELKKSASKSLVSGLNSGANVNDSETKIAILNALALLQDDTVGNKVRDHFDDKDIKVAVAAVTCAGQLKSKAMVEPLLQVLKDSEDVMNKGNAAATAPTSGRAMPAPRAMPNKGGYGSGAPSAANNAELQKKDRANQLLGASQSALSTLTSQNLRTYKEFSDWWSKARGTFNPK